MSNIRQSEKFEEQLQSLFQVKRDLLNESGSDAVNALRDSAFNDFMRLGIPTRFTESYKYTNLLPAFAHTYHNSFTKKEAFSLANDHFHCGVANMDTHNVYVINGWLDEANSEINGLPKGVIVGSFANCAKQLQDKIAPFYGKIASSAKDANIALNSAFAQDGFFIYIPDNVVVEKPIQVVNVYTSTQDTSIFQRNFVLVGKRAEVKLLYCDHSLSENRYLVNSVTEVVVDEEGIFDFYNVQNLHNLTTAINTLAINQLGKSKVYTTHLNLHTGLSRNNTTVELNGEESEANLFGLYLCDKSQHVDNFTSISHNSPNCYSNELYKGVMDNSSTGVFAGRVYVAKDAQKTNAFQKNNNLLLTSDARINTKPQLEIYADDVKCSHGATIGQLDDNAMFYLRSRGVGMEEARILLMYAFAYEVIEKIRVAPLKEQIRELVERTFRGELNSCSSCVVCGKTDN
ncbi:MAG: Fe-S cluster assembly protein SufD [Breznakibacter sp.]|nr:Fe-S cluster assembly protein SufD [Breznakibacter sp.]